MMHRIGTALATATTALALTLGVAASGAASADVRSVGRVVGCSMDRSPGVVTHWEFNHVRHDMTRRKVECVFGVRGHRIGSGFWVNGRFHIAIRYPNTDGTAVDEQYVDGHTDGRPPWLLAARRFSVWYPVAAS